MYISIQESNIRGYFTSEYLNRRYGDNIIYVRLGNEYVAIPLSTYEKDSIYHILVTSYREEVLWKQAMMLQMGKMPKTIEERKMYHVACLTEEDIPRHRYVIYEVLGNYN